MSRQEAAQSKYAADHPRAKGLLYPGGAPDDGPITPAKGKKMMGHDNAGTPFATNKDNNEGKYGAEPHVMRSKNRDIAAKAGTQDFGEATYASNIAANTVNMAESKARNSRSTANPTDGVKGPFAAELCPDLPLHEYTAIPKQKEMADKVSHADFGAEVYREQMQLNAAHHESARIKKYGGSTGSATPFAQFGTQGDEWVRADYKAKTKQGNVMGKVGSVDATFDSSVYESNRAFNSSAAHSAVQKKYASHVVLAHTPANEAQ